MTLAIANLRYVDPAHTLIDMDVTLDDGTVIPYTYHPQDNAQVALAVRALLDAGAYEVAPYEPPQVVLSVYAASKRYEKETGGITLNGIPIATDRQSQAMITGAYNYVQVNAAATIKWKAENGFVELNAAQITALALAVGAHVQACFAKEAEVVADANITTTEQVDDAFAAIATAY
jgi:hypothetical protein